MQFDVWSRTLPDLSVECIATGIFEDGSLGTEAAALDKATGGRIKGIIVAISAARPVRRCCCPRPG